MGLSLLGGEIGFVFRVIFFKVEEKVEVMKL